MIDIEKLSIFIDEYCSYELTNDSIYISFNTIYLPLLANYFHEYQLTVTIHRQNCIVRLTRELLGQSNYDRLLARLS